MLKNSSRYPVQGNCRLHSRAAMKAWLRYGGIASPPSAGADPNNIAKPSVEMRLVHKSAGQRHFGERLPRFADQHLGSLHSSRDDVFHRRQPNTVFEGAGEVTPARGDHIRQVIDIHFRFEIRFDIREGPPGLPGRQAARLKLVRARGINPQILYVRAEQRRRVTQAAPRGFAVRLEKSHGLPYEMSHPNGCRGH